MGQVNYSKLAEDETSGSGNSIQPSCNLPRSLVTTDYHVLLLLKSSVKVVNVLNEAVVLDDNYNEVIQKSYYHIYFRYWNGMDVLRIVFFNLGVG